MQIERVVVETYAGKQQGGGQCEKGRAAEDFAGVEFNQPPSPDRPVCSGFDGQGETAAPV